MQPVEFRSHPTISTFVCYPNRDSSGVRVYRSFWGFLDITIEQGSGGHYCTTPVSQAPYRMGPVDLEKVKEQLDESESLGFIKSTTSPSGVPLLLTGKKNGSKKLYIDHRKLNSVTIKNRYPPLRIDNLFDLLGRVWHVVSRISFGFQSSRLKTD